MIKKYLMRAIAETLFWIGDKVSYLPPGLFYPLYNKLMCASADIQDKYDLAGPWDPLRNDELSPEFTNIDNLLASLKKDDTNE